MIKYLVTGLISVQLLALHAQEKPLMLSLPYESASIPREHEVDFTHLKLNISFIPELGQVIGKVNHYFTPLRDRVDSLFLDAPAIKIERITHRNASLKYKTNAKGVVLYFNQSLKNAEADSIQIEYTALPRKGIYFIGWNDKTGRSRKQIWTQGQGIDNRHWIPMYDEMNDKRTTELIIKMPEPYKVLSNGVLLSKSIKSDGNTWHYKMSKPHAPYLIMLGIGEYEIEKRTSSSGVVSDLWYYPDHKNRVNNIYAHSAEMIDYFEKEIGVPYPWEAYAQIPVQDFMYGAMENTTATVFGDFFCNDSRGTIDRTYVGVNAHELAHQWFGDMVTARSSAHHWLQESFATHYNMLYEREAFGQDYFDLARRTSGISAIRASQKDLYPVGHSKGGSTRHYPKGAVVLDMLKYVTGRDAYNRAIKHYLQKHAYGNVSSQELLIAFHEALGLSLDWFWEQWVYRGGEPVFNVEAIHEPGKTVFEVKQLQVNRPYVDIFRMPVELEVHFTDGTVEAQKVELNKEQQSFVITYSEKKKVAFALFDPNSRIALKVLDFPKDFETLKAQALKAPFMLDRLDAVLAMDTIGLATKRATLIQVYKNEQFHAVKTAVIDQLIKDTDKKSVALLRDAFKDKDVKVRIAVLQAEDTLNLTFLKETEALLNDSSYRVVETAFELLCNFNPSAKAKYLDLLQGEVGNNNKNIRFAWLKVAIESGRKEYMSELVDYSSNSFEFNTRNIALNQLKELNYRGDDVLNNALDAAYNPNMRLRRNAISFLKWAVQDEQTKLMLNAKFQGLENIEDWRKEVHEQILKP